MPLPQPPVYVRAASADFALFAADLAPTAALLAAARLSPVRLWPGKAALLVGCLHYADSDLGSYDELMIAFPVVRERRLSLRRLARLECDVFPYWVPVTGAFTHEAGRALWGIPKDLADIDVRRGPSGALCSVTCGPFALRLDTRSRLRIPTLPMSITSRATIHTRLDGVLRRTPATLHARRPRLGLGGAPPLLGTHPVSDTLRHLGLPRRPLLTISTHQLGMRLDTARTLAPGSDAEARRAR
ncbi:hypothetical protein GCM10027074_64710 [Streptomyces deserti]